MNSAKVHAAHCGLSPTQMIRLWHQGALENQVEDAALMALATADSRGHASNRIVRILAFRDDGLVFTTHSGSLKGRQIAEVGWSSGVMYWPLIGQQIIVSGRTYPLSEEESDEFWDARPISSHPMTVASSQSMPLRDEEALRQSAAKLGQLQRALPRPAAYRAYLIEPSIVEFWQAAMDRLHHRLCYTRHQAGWRAEQLQP